MRLKKVFMMITAIVLLGCMTIPTVNAANDYSWDSVKPDACASDGTCMFVCGWENNTGSDKYSVFTYYYPATKEWKTTWYHPYNPFFTEKSDKKIPTNNIFYQNGEVGSTYTGLLQNLQCPNSAYVDTDGMGFSKELCFDDNSIYADGKSYCNSNPGGGGTAFGGTSTLKYSLTSQIKIYYDGTANMALARMSCSTMFSSSIDENKSILDKHKSEIETFLKTQVGDNKDGINYIQNTAQYKNSYAFYEKAYKEKLSTCKTQLEEENHQKVQNGEMTEEEKESASKKYDEIIAKTEDRLDNFQQEIGGIDWEKTPGFTVGSGCGMLGPELQNWLQWVFNIIKIVGPILAIALGMLDFAKAIVSGEDDAMKKASKKFMHRLIAAALLFLIPFILDIVLDFVGLTSSTCGIK